MTGLELLQATAQGTLPPASIAETMGMSLMEVNDGHVVIHATADRRHLNPMGGVHGGFAATVLDSVTACAVHTKLPAGTSLGTVDLGIKIVRPLPADRKLIAEGRVTFVSQSLGVAEATLRDTDGKLIASASATCFIRRPRSLPEI